MMFVHCPRQTSQIYAIAFINSSQEATSGRWSRRESPADGDSRALGLQWASDSGAVKLGLGLISGKQGRIPFSAGKLSVECGTDVEELGPGLQDPEKFGNRRR